MLEKMEQGTVFVLASNAMGRGDEALGEILMKRLINCLANSENAPAAILLYNAAVLLVKEGANTLDDLEKLAAQGVRVRACATCVEYYEISPQVGAVCTMDDILTEMCAAERLVTL